jgi:hypothetical protein
MSPSRLSFFIIALHWSGVDSSGKKEERCFIRVVGGRQTPTTACYFIGTPAKAEKTALFYVARHKALNACIRNQE